MDRKEKLKILRKLSEAELRREVLIPLFKNMGFKDVIEYHGIEEKGKDIIYYTLDNFGEKVYTGVVVKKGDITGSVNSHMGAKNVLFQIEQTLQEGYTDVYNLKQLVIDNCMIVTTGKIHNTTIESICGKLISSNLNKLVRFIDGEKLVELVDEWMLNFFQENLLPRNELIQERQEMKVEIKNLKNRINNLEREFRTFVSQKHYQINTVGASSFRCFKIGAPQCPLTPKKIKNMVFIAIPFKDAFEDIFKYGIVSAINEINKEQKLQPKLAYWRADETSFNVDLMCKICEAIQQSEYAIVDISTLNPNVMFELGLIYGVGNKVILLLNKGSSPPADLRGIRYFPYAKSDDVKRHIKQFFELEFRNKKINRGEM